MTKYIHTLAILVILGTGAVLGSTVIQTLAWTAAPNAPTDCDATKNDDCSPPINVGGTIQTKVGGLRLGSEYTAQEKTDRGMMLFDVKGKAMSNYWFTKTLQVGNGRKTGEPGEGKVLMALNDKGEAYWASLSTPTQVPTPTEVCTQDVWTCTPPTWPPATCPSGTFQTQSCTKTTVPKTCPTVTLSDPTQSRTCPTTPNIPPTTLQPYWETCNAPERYECKAICDSGYHAISGRDDSICNGYLHSTSEDPLGGGINFPVGITKGYYGQTLYLNEIIDNNTTLWCRMAAPGAITNYNIRTEGYVKCYPNQ